MKETIQFNGLFYDIVEANGLRFSTIGLLEDLFDYYGNPVSKEAESIDEKINYYFDESTFYSKTINELTNIYYEVRNQQNL